MMKTDISRPKNLDHVIVLLPGPAKHMGQWGICPHLFLADTLNDQNQIMVSRTETKVQFWYWYFFPQPELFSFQKFKFFHFLGI